MARQTTSLTATQVKEAKPKDKEYYLVDGQGLKLRIKPNGSKSWLLNYLKPISKKRTNLSLGMYPDLSLANARKEAVKARELLVQNIDPKEHRDTQRVAQAAALKHTLQNVAAQWFDIKKHSISHDHGVDIWRSLELHAFPTLGNTPVSEITAPKVINAIRPIEAQGKLDTVKRVNQRLNEIMDYAVNIGLIHANPISGIKAAFKIATKQNNPALTPKELPELMATLSHSNTKMVTKFLIEWQLHTMVRPNEAAGTRWDEIDFNKQIWIIPPSRMKKKKEHRVPLTPQSLAILEAIKPISGHREYVFPADRNPKKGVNSQTANAALKRMGFKDRSTAHGLRSLASTTLNEQGFDSDVIEAALAHVDTDKVRGVYNRTDYLERRRKVMHWWSEHIEQASIGSLSVTGFKTLKVVGS
ncbi:integrase domain-containing protein [Vibrio mangrovi]|uniref:Integrase domain-containing protein n=1 Tax=Vibrio mangrovi TaxID=474394 RepID=A0A1Y6IQI0_9VIBR|nr:integrase domain-containing protein [Vibrio mangrovi]MDW6003315.1 integrase domain-containing protein [Vibrio mangrovi]SMR99895.1 Prophage CP4-57 integrase [Vibrio mangrovi]